MTRSERGRRSSAVVGSRHFWHAGAAGRSMPGVGGREHVVGPTTEQEQELYTSMVRSRAFEETAISLAADGKLPGSWLSGIGQEGTLGVIGQLRGDDYLTYTHRGAYG